MGPERLEKPVAAHPQKTAVADFGTLLRATVKEAFAHVETSKERETAKTCSRSPDLEQAKSAVLEALTWDKLVRGFRRRRSRIFTDREITVANYLIAAQRWTPF